MFQMGSAPGGFAPLHHLLQTPSLGRNHHFSQAKCLGVTLWSGIPCFYQIYFLPNLFPTRTPRNPASPAACLQKWSIAQVQEKVGRWSKEIVMLPQNVYNPPLDSISLRGKYFVFSSHRWILFHEYIASFCKPVQPVPVCHGGDAELLTDPSQSCSGWQELIHSLFIWFLHKFGTCLSCSRRYHCRYTEIWICMNIDTNICNYDLHLCGCCHHFMVFGPLSWLDERFLSVVQFYWSSNNISLCFSWAV